MSHTAFQRYWLPGFLLQSVIIGGGYATGRELVEFFLGSGPAGGLLGMLVATVLFSIASVLCFELARLTRSYNYRSLLRHLLGKGWFVYEIAYFILCLLILAVIGAAARYAVTCCFRLAGISPPNVRRSIASAMPSGVFTSISGATST